jgi:hypothetical protein
VDKRNPPSLSTASAASSLRSVTSSGSSPRM